MGIKLAIGAIALSISGAMIGEASAQSVSSVFGPVVDADNRELELRVGTAQDANDDWSTVSRVHYQQGLSDSIRLRGLVQFADLGDSGAEFRFFQVELLWQAVEQTEDGYASGLRFDARLAEGGDDANQIGVNWIHQWKFTNGWQLRAIALTSYEVGGGARDGANLAFRSGLSRRFDNGLKLSFEQYSSLGNTDQGLGRFDEQKHTAGPAVSGRLTESLDWYVGVQFGLSDKANDQDFKFKLTRSF